ncbi:group II intron reverse transcriptase/maturase [Natranaerobius thermophilus]|uniref:RNA-directed DNA polymerase (Reverse transcriptase) n=1 Tax=Natranaerobius thermophilus (strain ATCC BAA-1301 / DSM 18059 / JW/NM-WN-LF) TaxID=457570 RepID=B2A795_NATTJ|nr:group II intron reverse transcriptase/maturase [Natranaerobius thermophilus]ACB84289.1 RNA-directed DNA polymerase (Reverse transcriptase) [Natranaerobius thermophilus JW/NM-WN-LF]
MKKWYSLIDKIYSKKNLEDAYRRVRANKGKPGIDQVTVEAYGSNLEENLETLHHDLKIGAYKPQPVRRVKIPKPDGSTRPLGIPTVKDRVVQQATLNILQPIFDPDFHPSSYGYRPNRSCHKAIAKSEQFINKYNLRHVVDMDLSKCFDKLNHELIIEEVAKKVSDGSVLKLIKKFLKSGVMEDGAIEDTEIGSPQGGVISPLLTNIYLDRFDKEMKSRNIRIVRYADDILIFAYTPRQAKRYKDIATEILEDELKLTVNKEKTHITNDRKGVPYLGVIIRSQNISIQPEKIQKFKEKVRTLTPRNHGRNLSEIIKELNPVLRGWANYFRIANCKKQFENLMKWIRRRLRMKKMREWKSWKQLHKTLRRKGYKGEFEKISMNKWRNSSSPLISLALPNKWFDEIGLINISTYQVGILHHFRE